MVAGFLTWQVGINKSITLTHSSKAMPSDLSSFPRWVQKFFSPCLVVGLNLIQYSGVSLSTPKHRSSTYHATLNLVIILSINLLLKWFNIYLYKNKIKSFVCTLLRIVHFLVSSLFVHQISQNTLISIFMYVSLSGYVFMCLHGKRCVLFPTNLFSLLCIICLKLKW